MLFVDTCALFFTSKDSEGASEFSPLSSVSPKPTFVLHKQKTSWKMGLQLTHRKQYVVQTTQNTEKMFAEFCDKLIKFAEQI